MDNTPSLPCLDLDQESRHPNENNSIILLPVELLLNVFSRLPQKDQLVVRKVCRRWVEVLSVSSPTFLNGTTFTIDPGTEAYSSLLASGVVWKRVQITGLLSTPESRDWFRSLNIGNTVRRLVLRNSAFPRHFLQCCLLGLPRLEELELINSQMVIHAGVEGAEAIRLWENFLKTRLKSLTVEVGKTEYLANYLELFTCPGSCLWKLSLLTRTKFPYDYCTEMNLLSETYYSREWRLLEKILRNFSSIRDFLLARGGYSM